MSFLSYMYVEGPKGAYTDKKENQIFLIYKLIQNGAVAKSYLQPTHIWLNICAFPHI